MELDIAKYKIKELNCLFNITSRLSSIRLKWFRCSHDPYELPPCYSFSFFNRGNSKDEVYENSRRVNECFKPNKFYFCDYDIYADWLIYYDQRMEELQAQLSDLKDSPEKIWECECKKEPKNEEEEPCVKWDHDSLNNVGNAITMIGLGIYNFDREMALEKKQYIKDAIYLNKDGDTLFKCQIIVYREKPKKICEHTTHTIIPGFKGLMKQNHTEALVLLPGKEQVLFFQKYNRSYKLYLDLRGKEEHKGKVFILKEITEQAATVETLKEELTKTE